MSNQGDKLNEILRECLEQTKSDLGVSAAYLAHCAMKKIDEESSSPMLVSWAANMELRQMARGLLRREYEPSGPVEAAQVEMFEKLQQRYPVKGEDCYMPLHALTEEQLIENEDRIRQTGEAFLKHADALRAYREEKISAGGF